MVDMIALVLGMLLGLSLAGAVVYVVATAARIEGREVLTERGEAVVDGLREKVEHRRAARVG